MTIPKTHVDHFLYTFIPRSRHELTYNPLKWVAWAILGNDEDGIFGEGPKSGKAWLKNYGGQKPDNGATTYDYGKISVCRFLRWQLRNPLHNFTHYVIGIRWLGKENIFSTCLIMITTQKVCFFKVLEKGSVFPMRDHSGIYLGLVNNFLPFISCRLYLGNWKKMDGYIGWRELGNFGIKIPIPRSI